MFHERDNVVVNCEPIGNIGKGVPRGLVLQSIHYTNLTHVTKRALKECLPKPNPCHACQHF